MVTANRHSIWLRCEKKEFERRSALSPATAKKLVHAGFVIFVERDDQRIFTDEEFEKVGCILVPNNTGLNAPTETPILGLKELEFSEEPLSHTHIQFGHCYKNQAGWSKVLSRFHRGGGKLYDLELLTHANGRRIAAFGYHAGFAGAACGALAYASQRTGEKLGSLEPFDNEGEMIRAVKDSLGDCVQSVKALVIGSNGRCGGGAIDLFRKIGLNEDNIVKWDLNETSKGGPFQEILDVDIFVNCIYLSSAIPPFVTPEQIRSAGSSRSLAVAVDVSCDTTNPYNPVPIYTINTTFAQPTVNVDVGSGNPPLILVSIDNLPSLLPREASERFSADLLPALLELPRRDENHMWVDAEKMFKQKLADAAKIEGL